MIAFCLLLQIRLEAGPSTPLAEPAALFASRTGKFLVLVRPKGVEILDGATLASLKKLEGAATSVGFDAKDETLWVVGPELARFDVADWKERFRAALPDVEVWSRRAEIAPRQALVLPDGQVLYRSKGGGLSEAKELDGKLVSAARVPPPLDAETEISGLLGTSGPNALVMFYKHSSSGAQARDRAYRLVMTSGPFALDGVAGRIVGVCEEGEAIYDPKTFKVSWHRKGPFTAGAIDVLRGRVFRAGMGGIRAWSVEDPETVVEAAMGRFIALAVGGKRLYGIEGQPEIRPRGAELGPPLKEGERRLRVWSLAD